MSQLKSLFRLWFGFSDPVSRGTYLSSGFFLFVIKYVSDLALTKLAHGDLWPPWTYLNPSVVSRTESLGHADRWLWVALCVLAFPFIWIGVSMSMRRAMNAGRSPWFGLLFLVPAVNVALLLVLATEGERPATVQPEATQVLTVERLNRFRVASVGIVVGVVIGLAMVALGTLVLRSYSSSLFIATPFFIGVSCGFIGNRPVVQSVQQTMALAVMAVFVTGLVMLLMALEGAMCILMAVPLALAMTIFGSLVGRMLAMSKASPMHGALILLLLPIMSGFDSELPPKQELFEAVSSVDIHASREAVWKNVVAFPEITGEPPWFFRHGISYPVRARIEGAGVGAMRYCEFSTGPFVEPITRWEEPSRLSFDVTSQPVPMAEWSPWKHVAPPHLDGYLQSRRGEFRLIELADGTTRLEGSTWYVVDVHPSFIGGSGAIFSSPRSTPECWSTSRA